MEPEGSAPLVSILSQMNPVHIITSYSFKIHFTPDFPISKSHVHLPLVPKDPSRSEALFKAW
jgi:hypothetical protein